MKRTKTYFIQLQILHVAAIAAELLVRAFPHLSHPDAGVAGQLGDKMQRDADPDLVMIGLELPRDMGGIVQFVQVLMILEADGERIDWVICETIHEGNIDRRVNAAREKCTVGCIGHHAFFDGCL